MLKDDLKELIKGEMKRVKGNGPTYWWIHEYFLDDLSQAIIDRLEIDEEALYNILADRIPLGLSLARTIAKFKPIKLKEGDK